jgi:membrane-associated phospholipid phosphatase
MSCLLRCGPLRSALLGLGFVGLAASVQLRAQTTNTRASLITRAQVWAPTDVAAMDLRRGPRGEDAFAPGTTIRCDYAETEMNGNSPKFACVLPSGDDLKVKYGAANGEVHGEVAATRLLWALGFGADGMYPVRVICKGCPDSIGVPTARPGERLVDPAVVERKMPGRELARGDQAGWSWLELDLIDEEAGGATRAQRDALKLLAVFMQHTDSKPEQQRLVCLDEGDAKAGAPCERTLMIINDVGLTFGRANLANRNLTGSVNLQEWSQTPVWKDGAACVGNLPRSFTGTLKDPIISEDGREFLADLLVQLSDSQIRALFEAARADLRSLDVRGVSDRDTGSTEPNPSVDDWVTAFKAKRREIVDRRCDVPWPGGMAALFGTGPIRWLQSHASYPLTLVMNGISLLGYTRAYMATAVALAFLVNLRAGAALLLLIALNGVLTDGVKVLVSSPRPDAVDSGVQVLSVIERLGESFRSGSATPSVDADDGYGFPSGHVSAATVFFFGLVFLFRWQWAWVAMACWIPLMALSRLYLGRHFLGDTLGGVAVGVIAVSIGVLALVLARLSNPKWAPQVAGRALILSGTCAMLALMFGIPAAYDAGRFLGLSAGVMLLVRYSYGSPTSDHRTHAGGVDAASLGGRAARLALAALLFGVAWWGTYEAIDAADVLNTPGGALLAGALPAMIVLPGPLYLHHLVRTRGRRLPIHA